MTDWQPIETAPLDEKVLVWDGSEVTVGTQEFRGSFWVPCLRYPEPAGQLGLTYWAPLPSPPSGD